MVELVYMVDPRLYNKRIARNSEVTKLSECVLCLALTEGEEQN